MANTVNAPKNSLVRKTFTTARGSSRAFVVEIPTRKGEKKAHVVRNATVLSVNGMMVKGAFHGELILAVEWKRNDLAKHVAPAVRREVEKNGSLRLLCS